MPLDIQWRLTFLPQFHHVSLIKPSFWDFESFNFPPMPVFMVAAPLVAGSALALFFLIALRPLANYGVVVPLPAELALTVHSAPQELIRSFKAGLTQGGSLEWIV